MMQKRTLVFAAVTLMAGCSAIALAAAGHTVYYHDQVLTQDAREINGKTYVPLADVARALGGRVAPHGTGVAIVTGSSGSSGGGQTAEGGANQVNGTQGKVGDWFFDGRWRFRVNSVERMESERANKYSEAGQNKPASAKDTLVVVNCTIKNGHKEAEEPILSKYGLSTQQTAMTDDQGQSYAPADFDVRGGNLASGAAKNFAVIFSVPKEAKLKEMIFSIYGYHESTHVTHVRVAIPAP